MTLKALRGKSCKLNEKLLFCDSLKFRQMSNVITKVVHRNGSKNSEIPISNAKYHRFFV